MLKFEAEQFIIQDNTVVLLGNEHQKNAHVSTYLIPYIFDEEKIIFGA